MLEPKFKKVQVAFLVVVPLLLTTALVRVDDPNCGGTGHISSARGMDQVQIHEVKSEEIYASKDANYCGMYAMYLYEVVLSVTNSGEETAEGYAKLVLVDLNRSAVIDNQYVWVEIPKRTSLELSYRVWFQSKVDFPLYRTDVHSEIMTEDRPCPICNGTGEIPFNVWLVVSSLKDSFKELTREQAAYQPPPAAAWDPGTEQDIPIN